MKTEDLVKLALLAGGVYVLYQLFNKASAAAGAVAGAATGAYRGAVNAVASGLYAAFGPDDAAALGSMTYLMVSFSDGSRHAVPANTVDADGFFVWTGYPPGSQAQTGMQLVKDANGNWYAF